MTYRPSRTIDINADLGEGLPHDEEILEVVSSASISCGAHAGDRSTILQTLRLAKARDVAVGAHPGYADREGFGRRERSVTRAEVEELVLEQFATLAGWAAEVGVDLRFVKPHGALYNQAQTNAEIADGLLATLEKLRLPIVGLPSGVLAARAPQFGVRFIPEGFPDRRYDADGHLVPRTEPGAVLGSLAEIEQQVRRLMASRVETLCVHGDDPRAVDNARTILAVLGELGIAIESFA
jgi:UPF0271 protein